MVLATLINEYIWFEKAAQNEVTGAQLKFKAPCISTVRSCKKVYLANPDMEEV